MAIMDYTCSSIPKDNLTCSITECLETITETMVKRRVNKKSAIQISRDIVENLNFNVSLYKIPPANCIEMSELCELVENRLKLFKIMYLANQQNLKSFSKEWVDYIEMMLHKFKLLDYSLLLHSPIKDRGKDTLLRNQARRCDYIAHFVLRFAYCKNIQQIRWFVQLECEWFLLRYNKLPRNEKVAFLKENRFTLQSVSTEEIVILKHRLMYSSNNDLYKIPFQDVPVLVGSRKACLYKGYVYLQFSDIVYFVQTKFQRHLIGALHGTRLLDEDARLEAIWSNVVTDIPSENLNLHIPERKFTAYELDQLATDHYPLCMQNLHNQLRSNHHLRYLAKVHYGIFLRYIGLPYESAMEFWKTEFTRTIDEKLYIRKYEYLFRHQYRKVGFKNGYKPHSCDNIIKSKVGFNDNHCCPFRHWSIEKLEDNFSQKKLSLKAQSKIKDYLKNGKCKLACTEYYKAIHHEEPNTPITHPVIYFENSYSYFDDIT